MAEPAVVTGAAGFIGRHLVASLLADGGRVIGIDRRPVEERFGLTPLVADLSEPDAAVAEALERASVVYHLAGCPGVRDRSADVDWRRQRDNVHATAQTLALTPLRTQVVVASSSSVYGGTSGQPCREDQPTRPRGGYARSKVEVERLCAERLERGGAVIAARFFTVAGEFQRRDMALANWIDLVCCGRRVVIFGSTERTRDITDVRDVVSAVRLLATGDAAGVVNVGTGRAYSLAQMLDAIGAAVGRPVEFDIDAVGPDDPDATLADPARLLALTGFQPQTDLMSLVQRQVDAATQFDLATERGSR